MYKYAVFLLLHSFLSHSQIKILDNVTNNPVSYATISFGNGFGVFADNDGEFLFNERMYPDVDSLYISAIGYKNATLPSKSITSIVSLQPEISELDEVLLIIDKKRKFKEERIKPHLDDDYYNCWLPTIASEIAVFFEKTSDKDQKVTHVIFPIALESKEWKKRKRSNTDKKSFSTLFKVMFYNNVNGLPGDALCYETIVFRATEKNGDKFNLNVSDYDIYIPKDGFFVSLQVLGYTDNNGNLLPNKKYKEIKTKQGLVKIPTNFRPLLPFTDKVKAKNTLVRRIFINNNRWVKFDKGHGFKSALLDRGLFNYGIGITLQTYANK